MSLNSFTQDGDIYTYGYFLQEDVCRLCWNRNADREIISKSNYDKNELVDLIKDCLDINITQNNYPNKICLECCSQVEKFYNFKIVCRDNDRKLNEIIEKEVKEGSTKLPFVVKLENKDNYDVESSKNDNYCDAFSNCFQSSDVDSDHQIVEETKKKRGKVKRYKPKRSPTYCNICRLDYKNKEKFSIHNAESHGIEDGLYKCFGCEKRFKSRKTRLGHEINFCKGLKDGYKCVLCARYLPKRRMYEAHMRDHRDKVSVVLPEDIFECMKCFKTFTTRENLKKHMLVHESDRKNFVCESCGRFFTRQDYLHKHKLTHTGVKQHECPHCSFKATQRSTLTVHIRKHTGERPYSCDMCPQRCISSSNLRAHRRRHLGVKRYECKICNKKFGYKISLDEHVSSTHEHTVQSHSCQHCGATYTRVRGLRRHLLAKHEKEEKPAKNENKDDFLKTIPEQTDLYLKMVNDSENGDQNKVENIVKDVRYQLKENEQFIVKNQDGVFVI